MKNSLEKYVYSILSSLFARKAICMDEFVDDKVLKNILKKNNVQDFSISVYKNDKYDFISSYEGKFRLASITKMIVSIIVMRLYEKNILDIDCDISDYLGYKIRNPIYPFEKISIRNILNHSSSIVDSEKYFESMNRDIPFYDVLSFSNYKPGTNFIYSNFAYGLLEIIFEKVSSKSFNELILELAKILEIDMTIFPDEVATCYRVFPKSKNANFELNENTKKNNEKYFNKDLEYRYHKAPGAICVSSKDLLKILVTIISDKNKNTNIILSKKSIEQMLAPCFSYPKKERKLYHGLGVLIVDDDNIYKNKLYGHQGFAYGAVNGAFFDPNNNFACAILTAGAKEYRNGHFSVFGEQILNYLQKYV